MKLLGRYIASSVLSACLAVLVVIMGLDIIFTLLDELDRLKNDYGLGQLINYLLLRLPGRIYLFLPIAILVGVLVGLGNLAGTSELTVMRAAGVSIPRLVLHACKPVFYLLLLAMLASEFVLPRLDQFASTYRWEKLNAKQQTNLFTSRDLWLKEDNKIYSVNLARNDGQLLGIKVFELNADWSLKSVLSAAKATFNAAEASWELQQAQQVTYAPTQLVAENHTRLKIDLPIQPEFIALQAFAAADLPPSSLAKYAIYLSSNGQPSGSYWLEFWKKILLPLTVFSVVILGASFTFGPLRSVPAATRVFHGLIIALGVKFAQDLLGPTTLLWGVNPILAVLIPALSCTAVGFWFIYKAS